ncbi:hypothetical protein BC835DRAFT_1425269 [Cytidiella melzeri]|nr:hypothetical protein BC835DRAFT_1425269 [Cytidiella melzeri]
MPEGPALLAWAHRMKRTVSACHKDKAKTPVTGRILIMPRCFSVGTEAKGYVTCRALRDGNYQSAMDATTDVQQEHLWPSEMDHERSAGMEWEYLLQPRRYSKLAVSVCGKTLAISAGHHLVFVNFGLEASVMKVTANDFEKIAGRSQDIEGPNSDQDKASQMRSFAIPDGYKDPMSVNPDALSRLNIFLVLECSNGDVWLFVDHVRLIRFEVHSRHTEWEAEDLALASEVWLTAWNGKYGPDWFQETTRPSAALHLWRTKKQNLLRSGKCSKTSTTMILDAMCEDMTTFNGSGKHTATDVLHEIGLLPYMPLAEVVRSDEIFARFHDGLLAYTAKFKEKKYVERVACESNDPNPFAFHHGSNDAYIGSYVAVYRRQQVKVTKAVYNPYVSQGTPYCGNMKPVPDTGGSIWVYVYYHLCPDSSKETKGVYSIILAAPPRSWKVARWKPTAVEKDVHAEGRKTTLGSAQFAQYNANITHVTTGNQPLAAIRGRRPVIRTGKRGRPLKAKTLAEREALEKRGTHVVYPEAQLARIQKVFDDRAAIANPNAPDTYSLNVFFKRIPNSDDTSTSTTTTSKRARRR